ncbi:MAG: DUF2290 domain-containing protein [Methylophilaceae bacterium]
MRFAHAQQGVKNAVTALSHVIQTNNIHVDINKQTISWFNRLPGFQKDLYYPFEYQALLDKQQYSLLLADGSFLQIFYDFSGGAKLRSARLALYPQPIATRITEEELLFAAEEALDRQDEELYEHLYNWSELIELKGRLPANTSHIRFDFDSTVVAHSVAHLQLGAIQEFRVPADFFPQPLGFVQLCRSLIGGELDVPSPTLGFERKHVMRVIRPDDLMVLGSTT